MCAATELWIMAVGVEYRYVRVGIRGFRPNGSPGTQAQTDTDTNLFPSVSTTSMDAT